LGRGGPSFRRAIELTPNQSDAHREYGLCLASQGSTDEAVAETRRALQLDPVNLFNNFAVGWALIGARRYDEVIEHFNKSLEIDPRFVAAHHFIGLGYVGKRMFREGLLKSSRRPPSRPTTSLCSRIWASRTRLRAIGSGQRGFLKISSGSR
jgi:tetratricopeptide (TPR) repeat protein